MLSIPLQFRLRLKPLGGRFNERSGGRSPGQHRAYDAPGNVVQCRIKKHCPRSGSGLRFNRNQLVFVITQ